MMRKYGISTICTGVLILAATACGKPAEAPAPAPPPTTMAPMETTVAPEMTGETLDLLKDAMGWDNYKESDAMSTLAVVTSDKGEALEVTYDLKKGNWLGIAKPAGKDLSAFKGIKFLYKGEGKTNRLEFKIEDKDGSNFGMVQAANMAEWTPVEIKFADVPYMWGGDKELDLKEVRLHWAVSKQANDQGGSGKVTIAGLELIP